MENLELNVFVTGGTGFIGSNLIKGLLNRGANVYALIRPNSSIGLSKIQNLKGINYVVSTSRDLLKKIDSLPRFDVCFHLASYGVDYRQNDYNLLINGNINFTMEILQFCKFNKTKVFINTGSCFEYGMNNKRLIKEDDALNPETIYSATKVSNEIIAKTFCKNNNIKLILVRPFGVFGPNEGMHRLVPQIMKAGIKNEPLKLTMGNQVRDYLYIDDLINAYIELALSDNIKSNEIYNICSSKEITIRKFINKIIEVCNFNRKNYLFGEIPYRLNEDMYFVGDNSKLKKIIGWSPQFSIEDGIKMTYLWYKNMLKEKI